MAKKKIGNLPLIGIILIFAGLVTSSAAFGGLFAAFQTDVPHIVYEREISNPQKTGSVDFSSEVINADNIIGAQVEAMLCTKGSESWINGFVNGVNADRRIKADEPCSGNGGDTFIGGVAFVDTLSPTSIVRWAFEFHEDAADNGATDDFGFNTFTSSQGETIGQFKVKLYEQVQCTNDSHCDGTCNTDTYTCEVDETKEESTSNDGSPSENNADSEETTTLDKPTESEIIPIFAQTNLMLLWIGVAISTLGGALLIPFRRLF